MNEESEKPIKRERRARCATLPSGRPAGEKAICYLEAGGEAGLWGWSGGRKCNERRKRSQSLRARFAAFHQRHNLPVWSLHFHQEADVCGQTVPSEGVTREGLDGKGGRGKERRPVEYEEGHN